MILERLGNSDALYHNAEHTMLVTLVGQQILRGRLQTESIHPDDWLHFIMALLVNDIGFRRGSCPGDSVGAIVADAAGGTITPPRGASDAYLAPWHVDRGIIYVRHRIGPSSRVDEERIATALDFARLPIPEDPRYIETASEPALVRAADLIGQLAAPFYHRKINLLFHEFVETGTAARLGYRSPLDLADKKNPEFLWSAVEPLIGAGDELSGTDHRRQAMGLATR